VLLGSAPPPDETEDSRSEWNVFATKTEKEEESSNGPQLEMDPTYKVHAEIGTAASASYIRILTVDTAAGPALIRPDVIPQACRYLIEPCRDVFIRSATNHKKQIEQMKKLQIRIGDMTTWCYFGLAPDLPPGVLIGTAFINRHISIIDPERHIIRPKGSKAVPILNRDGDSVCAIHAPMPLERFDPDGQHVALTVARGLTIPALSQALTLVRANANGIISVQGNNRLYEKRGCQVANGLAEVHEGYPFWIWIANFTQRDQYLPKRMTIGAVASAPDILFHRTAPGTDAIEKGSVDWSKVNAEAKEEHNNAEEKVIKESDANPITHVNVTRLGKKTIFEDFAKRHEEVLKSDKNDVEKDWRSLVNIDEKYEAYKDKLTTMLERHQGMWDGHLGSIKATRHYIELTEGARPVRSHPYRAGPTQRE